MNVSCSLFYTKLLQQLHLSNTTRRDKITVLVQVQERIQALPKGWIMVSAQQAYYGAWGQSPQWSPEPGGGSGAKPFVHFHTKEGLKVKDKC